MNILIVNQSVIDMCASFIILLTAVVEVDGSRMSRDSIYDQFVCGVWLSRAPLWTLSVASTYGILITAFERYFAVINPIWYNVSTDKAYPTTVARPIALWQVIGPNALNLGPISEFSACRYLDPFRRYSQSKTKVHQKSL